MMMLSWKERWLHFLLTRCYTRWVILSDSCISRSLTWSSCSCITDSLSWTLLKDIPNKTSGTQDEDVSDKKRMKRLQEHKGLQENTDDYKRHPLETRTYDDLSYSAWQSSLKTQRVGVCISVLSWMIHKRLVHTEAETRSRDNSCQEKNTSNSQNTSGSDFTAVLSRSFSESKTATSLQQLLLMLFFQRQGCHVRRSAVFPSCYSRWTCN